MTVAVIRVKQLQLFCEPSTEPGAGVTVTLVNRNTAKCQSEDCELNQINLPPSQPLLLDIRISTKKVYELIPAIGPIFHLKFDLYLDGWGSGSESSIVQFYQNYKVRSDVRSVRLCVLVRR